MKFSVEQFQEQDNVLLTPSFIGSAKDLYGNLSAFLDNPIVAFNTAGAGIITLHDRVFITPARLNPPVLIRELAGIDIIQALALSICATRWRALAPTQKARVKWWNPFAKTKVLN